MLENEKWSSSFKNFVFPYGFYVTGGYDKLLKDADFSVKRLQMHSQDMSLEGEKGLFAWIAFNMASLYIADTPRVERGLYK